MLHSSQINIVVQAVSEEKTGKNLRKVRETTLFFIEISSLHRYQYAIINQYISEFLLIFDSI